MGLAYLKLYVSDFWGDELVQEMSPPARLAYLALLTVAWQRGPLRDPQRVLERRLGADPALWEEIRAAWTETPGGWVQARLERDRAAQEELRQKRVEAGSKGGRTAAEARAEHELSKCSDLLKPPSPTPTPTPTPTPKRDPEGAGAPARPRSGIKLALALLPELAPTVAGDAEGAGAWEEWARFKSSSRKPLSARAIRKQLAQAEREGPAWLVGAVEHSIRSDYQGLYPPSPARNGAPGSGNPAIDRLDAMAKRHAPPTPQPEEPRTVELEP